MRQRSRKAQHRQSFGHA